jgi:hypothetical protein
MVALALAAQSVLFGPVVQDHSHQLERRMNNETLYPNPRRATN